MNNMEKVFNTAVAILATFYVSIWWLGFSFKDFNYIHGVRLCDRCNLCLCN